jgi:hypothetical protein
LKTHLARHLKKGEPKMFTEKELAATRLLAASKIDDILEEQKEFTAESLSDLQTLLILKDAAENKLQKYK